MTLPTVPTRCPAVLDGRRTLSPMRRSSWSACGLASAWGFQNVTPSFWPSVCRTATPGIVHNGPREKKKKKKKTGGPVHRLPVRSTIEPSSARGCARTRSSSSSPFAVDENEFDRDIDQAFRKIAREVRLPGFRAGKAPRRCWRRASARAAQQALRDSVAGVPLERGARARGRSDRHAVGRDHRRRGGGPGRFDATCEVRPEITLPGYGGLRVELPALDPSQDDVEAAHPDRGQAGTVRSPTWTVPVAVRRPGHAGRCRRSGPANRSIGLNTEDWLYEVGQGWVAPGFDAELLGSSVGDEGRTSPWCPTAPSEEADFTVAGADPVQEVVLPAIHRRVGGREHRRARHGSSRGGRRSPNG